MGGDGGRAMLGADSSTPLGELGGIVPGRSPTSPDGTTCRQSREHVSRAGPDSSEVLGERLARAGGALHLEQLKACRMEIGTDPTKFDLFCRCPFVLGDPRPCDASQPASCTIIASTGAVCWTSNASLTLENALNARQHTAQERAYNTRAPPSGGPDSASPHRRRTSRIFSAEISLTFTQG